MKVIKRNGQEVNYDINKIKKAISKANLQTKELSDEKIDKIVEDIDKKIQKSKFNLSVEDIQDIVEKDLIKYNAYETSKEYITFRYKRSLTRNNLDGQILSLIEYENEEVKQENSNKNPRILSVQRDYMAGVISKDISERILLPKEIVQAHKEGVIHFHDMDYFVNHMANCSLVNLEDMLQNGTVISGVGIDKPKSFRTACTIASQIVAQVASSQYGGQTISLSHLVPFVEISRQKIKKELKEELQTENIEISDEKFNNLVENKVKKEINDGIQIIQYQLITLQTTNGQAPFVSVMMYLNEVPENERDDLALLIESMLNQRIKGVKNSEGVYITPAFPKLLYVLQEDNIKKSGKYYYLTKLAAECTAKRMVPDYISEKIMLDLKGDVYPCMGCRSYLSPDRFTKVGKHKYYGRFNQGVVTLNLVDVALSSEKDQNKFWDLLDSRLELCHRALQERHKRLKGTLSDVAPIMWQYGALARLKPGQVIDDLLYHGYSTISLGYAGIAEMTKYMTDNSHTSEKGKEFALKVMQKLNDKCQEWKLAEDIDYSVYGSPIESGTYRFAKLLQKKFGIIEGITDKNYITNSYHISVTENIDAFSKLIKESAFQKLSPGGAISYVEVPNLVNNLDAVMSVLECIYENIQYAELNTRSDYCCECKFTGEIPLVNEDNKLIWKCPKCGCTDTTKLVITRRTCGYIGTAENGWNQGRLADINNRVLHL
nr:MAG TPA: anaerobic ribonucleoside triphosphate reductase [Caudoviricetes sp.]